MTPAARHAVRWAIRSEPAAIVAFVLALCVSSGARGDESPAVAERPADVAARPSAPAALPWLDSLAGGYTAAERSGHPIIVKAGGAACPWCRVLDEEIRKAEAQQELARWTRVSIDVDTSPDDARLLAVGAIPALRILTRSGKLVAAREGAMTAEQLVSWLSEHHAAAALIPAAELTESGPPDATAVKRLVREFGHRDASLREAAVRRLRPHPHVAAAPVVSAFHEGPLASRLTALELLDEWKAPIEDLDPWRPETITTQRLDELTAWAAALDGIPPADKPAEISPAELAEARAAIDRMLAAEPGQARAIRERLARFGRELLPEVYARLQTAATDADRQRLTVLRYRLVSGDALALGWPGGLERLAATDLDTRQRAADELARRASQADEPLLLELFSDPAPLVREISLRALRAVGGSRADSALLRLLDDPEPNVRAAVLKQLAEEPPSGIVPKIAAYAAREEDADLVVHAVRLLREVKGDDAIAALKPLLKHESWRVRAESAEALAESIKSHGISEPAPKREIHEALVEALGDSDGFVVSRAVAGLQNVSLHKAIDPLAAAAVAHPELAASIVGVMASGQLPENRVVPHLEQFAAHERPPVRAAAIEGLCRLLDNDSQPHLAAALADPVAEVRIAGADAFFQMLKQERPGAATESIDETGVVVEEIQVETIEEPVGGVLAGIARLFGGWKPQPPAGKEPPQVHEPAEAERPPEAAHDGNEAGAKAVATGEDDSEGDRVLARIRAGKVFDRWQFEMADRLLPLLSAAGAEERVAAALPLTALGRDAQALPVLRAVLAERRQLPRIAQALPWLLWSERTLLFDELSAAAANADELEIVARSLAELPGPRPAARLWDLLGERPMTALESEAVRQALVALYFPQHEWQPREAPLRARKEASEAARRFSASGTRWQRMVALSLLMRIEAGLAAQVASTLFENAELEPALRADAFQALLLAETETRAASIAVAGLTSDLPEVRRRALALLAMGKQELMTLESGRFELADYSVSIELFSGAGTDEPVVLEPPRGLRPEPLLAQLEADGRDAALAGYLLVLLDRPEGLPVLLDHWQSAARSDPRWTRLVYRAVAHHNDPRHVPLLREIYETMKKDPYPNHREFYWTIRVMSGPEILALRKQMRDEIGMAQLR